MPVVTSSSQVLDTCFRILRCAETSQPLPAPTGGHEWEALQAAVNDSVAAFGAAAAKMGWKKWALTRAHSGAWR